MNASFRRVWGGAQIAATRTIGGLWIDALLLLTVCGIFFFFIHEIGRVNAANSTGSQVFEINLSPKYLPLYTLESLCRGMIAYFISLMFTFAYGYWAAKDHRAEKVLIPLLDILQSIPVLGFMPGLVLAMVALFPNSPLGVELAAIIMIFTGQVWNMTFSLYRSLRTVNRELVESATIFRFTIWQKVTKVELPYSTIGLVWNSMMSMAGGWFFLSLSENFQLGNRDFRLPGLGSYVSVAMDQHRYADYGYAIIAMVTMIVSLDQLLWRPLVAWSQKFRIEDGGAAEVAESWFLDLLRSSRLVRAFTTACTGFARRRGGSAGAPVPAVAVERPKLHLPWYVGIVPLGLLLLALAWGGVELIKLMKDVSFQEWIKIIAAGLLSFLRVVISIIMGTLWAVPAGLAIGLSPRLSRIFQPIIQIAASFPAPMLFPMVIIGMAACGVHLGVGSIMLMLLGSQWYVLFNVIAGASAIPADLREAAHSYGIVGWKRFWQLYLPAIFPALVNGWVTASGAAWNTSIVAEYYSVNNHVISTFGLGAMISDFSLHAHLPQLAAALVVMSLMVVGINRLLWHRLYHLAETTFSLNK